MIKSPQVLLASSSTYRRELLNRLLNDFQCVSPDVDERAFADASTIPGDLARLLAEKKSEAVATQHPQAIVIGSDQVVDLDGRILGKPDNAEAAIAQLTAMSGRTHRLVTAVCVLAPHARFSFTNETRLTMRALTEAEIERYVAHDRPLDCAGSYKIECRGIALFDHVVTEDFTAIMGLPLLQLSKVLRDMGINTP